MYAEQLISHDLEHMLYDLIVEEGIARKAVKMYPGIPAERLAQSLTEGLSGSCVGDVIKVLDSQSPTMGFETWAVEAFRQAMLRALEEVSE